MFGFLNINKAKSRTSRAVVNSVQKIVKPSKVGHAGTLDPLATGVLIVCVGPATRLTQFVQRSSKTYLATFRLGLESDSEDIFGTITDLQNPNIPSADDIRSVLPEFVGLIDQIPPKFSALKVNGKRAYSLARKGAEFELKPRKIQIDGLEFVSLEYPNFQIEIECGSGTYVRSLGRDIGRRLGSGAVMTALERTAIGKFSVENSLDSKSITLETIQKHLVAPQDALPNMNFIKVGDEYLEKFFKGEIWKPTEPNEDQQLGAIDQSGRLLTILNKRPAGHYTPKTNFSSYWREQESGGS